MYACYNCTRAARGWARLAVPFLETVSGNVSSGNFTWVEEYPGTSQVARTRLRFCCKGTGGSSKSVALITTDLPVAIVAANV